MDMMDPLPNVKQEKIKLHEINEYLTCPLCKGYFIDATTISECLHSFCRSCIIKFLQDNSHCPICEVIINKAKPNIKLDKTLQDIVYKLVPELFIREMARRQDFYRSRPEAAAKATPEERGVDTERTIFNPKDAISLCIEYISDDSTPGAINVPDHTISRQESRQGEAEPQMKRFLQCPGNCRIEVLKKFVQNKYNVDINRFHIELLYKRVPLPNHYTLIDIAYIYSWKRNEPMKFFFRIMEQSTNEKIEKVDHIFVKPPRSFRDRSKKLKETKKEEIIKETKLVEPEDVLNTDKIKAEIKNNLKKVNGKGPVFTNITLNRNRNIEIITKVQKVSNKNGQPIGLNIIKKTVKKPGKLEETPKEEDVEEIAKQEGILIVDVLTKNDVGKTKEIIEDESLKMKKIEEKSIEDSKIVVSMEEKDDTKTVMEEETPEKIDESSTSLELDDCSLKIDEDCSLKIDEDHEEKIEEESAIPCEENSTKHEKKSEDKLTNPSLRDRKIDHYDFEIEDAKEKFPQKGSYRSILKSPCHQPKTLKKPDEEVADRDDEDEKSRFLKSIELTAKTALETLHQVKIPSVNSSNQAGQIFIKITQKRKSVSPLKNDKAKKSKRKSSPVKNVPKVEKMMESVKKNASDLQSIFTNCKFNIPSSLSITLKETNEKDDKAPVKMEPVMNYIEILKIPEASDQNCLKSKSAPALGGNGKTSFQRMFEESIKSPNQPSQKRNLTMIANQLQKKTKLDEEKTTPPKVKSPLKTPPPNMKFQQISAKLRSPSLGMNFTVSVDQQVQNNYGKLDSVFCDFAKKSSPKEPKEPKKRPNILKAPPVQNGLRSPKVQENHVQVGQHIIGVVKKSPKPVDLVQSVPKVSQTPKKSPQVVPKSPQVVPILPKPPKDASQPALSTNQILEKYNIQNLAQLSASLNFNHQGIMGVAQPAQLAFQQAILKQFELQNHQNWRMSQYQAYHRASNPNNRLVSKEN